VEECEAESISYLVCTRLGIETPSAEYLAGYLGEGGMMPPISLENGHQDGGFDSADGAVPAAITEKLPGRVNKKHSDNSATSRLIPAPHRPKSGFPAFRRTLSAFAGSRPAPQPRAAADNVCSADPPQITDARDRISEVILFAPDCAQLALKWRRRPKS